MENGDKGRTLGKEWGLERQFVLSKTDLGRKVPGSRTKGRAGSEVRLLGRRPITPQPTRPSRPSLKPQISLNCYSLFHATIKSKRPALRAMASSYNDQELIYIARAKTMDAFFRAIQGKVGLRSLASRSNPLLSKSRPESRIRTERGNCGIVQRGDKLREQSLGSLVTARVQTHRIESKLEAQSVGDSSLSFLGSGLNTSPNRPRTALQVIGLASARAVSHRLERPVPAPPPQSQKDPPSPLSPATVFPSNLPSPPSFGWRPLHTRILRLSPTRLQKPSAAFLLHNSPVLKGLAS